MGLSDWWNTVTETVTETIDDIADTVFDTAEDVTDSIFGEGTYTDIVSSDVFATLVDTQAHESEYSASLGTGIFWGELEEEVEDQGGETLISDEMWAAGEDLVGVSLGYDDYDDMLDSALLDAEAEIGLDDWADVYDDSGLDDLLQDDGDADLGGELGELVGDLVVDVEGLGALAFSSSEIGELLDTLGGFIESVGEAF